MADSRFDQSRSLMEFLETFLEQAEKVGIDTLPISISSLREICGKLTTLSVWMEEYETCLREMTQLFGSSEAEWGGRPGQEWMRARIEILAKANELLDRVKTNG